MKCDFPGMNPHVRLLVGLSVDWLGCLSVKIPEKGGKLHSPCSYQSTSTRLMINGYTEDQNSSPKNVKANLAAGVLGRTYDVM